MHILRAILWRFLIRSQFDHLFFWSHPNCNFFFIANSHKSYVVVFKFNRVLWWTHSRCNRLIRRRLFDRIYKNSVISVRHSKTKTANSSLDNFTIKINRNEHPFFNILTIFAFMIRSLIQMWFLLLPVAKFNRYNRFFVNIFNLLNRFNFRLCAQINKTNLSFLKTN